MGTLFAREIVEQLPRAWILRARRRFLVEPPTLDFHGGSLFAHGFETERLHQPDWLARDKSADVRAADQGNVISKTLAIEFDEPAPVSRLLGAHGIEHCGRRREILSETFGVIRISAFVVFFERDREGEYFAFGEAVEFSHVVFRIAFETGAAAWIQLTPMSETRLEFNDEEGRRIVRLDKDLFTIGRRAENDLQLNGKEVSREHAVLIRQDGQFILRDRDSRFGTFVNGERVTERRLANHDRLRFGGTDPELLFITVATGSTERVTDLVVGDLRQISLLLEGLRAIGSSRVLNDVLALVLDSAIDVSGAQRGFIMLADLADNTGKLEFKLGRGRGRRTLDGTVFKTSRRIPEQVFFSGQPQYVTDILEGDLPGLHDATIALGIRNVLCVPLRLVRLAEGSEPGAGGANSEERRIGVLYLDSQDKGTLGTHVTGTALETLATEAAVAIENTRLYGEAMEKDRMAQELSIAAEVQQSLLPSRQRTGPGFEAVGAMIPCRAIGGDFFDYLDLPDGRVGFILCDVSGKGAPAALMTAMIQGVFRGQAEDGHGPALSITRVNRVLARRNVGSRYATGFYGILAGWTLCLLERRAQSADSGASRRHRSPA